MDANNMGSAIRLIYRLILVIIMQNSTIITFLAAGDKYKLAGDSSKISDELSKLTKEAEEWLK